MEQYNKMCLDCPHLDNLCDGSHDNLYSGCVWKTADAETFEKFLQRVNGKGADNGKN